MSAPERIGGYRVERALGIGGFASVWLGYDEVLDAHVAIKVLADNWSQDLRVRERFITEARLLWRLDDQRVIRVLAVGQLDDGRPYLVMDWADRGSLRERLQRERLGLAEALALLREIAAGVAVLHRQRVVHRDLSPGNILFRTRPDGREQLVIADLGLAKALAGSSGLTMAAGTPGYMAPEQADPLSQVDLRADVYALGALGRTLANAGDGRTAPMAVEELFARACADDPDDRFADADAFGAALDELNRSLGADRVGHRPAGSLRDQASVTPRDLPARSGGGRSPARRRPRVLAVAAVLLVGLAAGGAVWYARAGVTAHDATGSITVQLPHGWSATGSGWSGQADGSGRPAPALVVSPDPSAWRTDPQVPGAFVGLSAALAGQGSTPADFVQARPHPGCTASATLDERLGGFTWTVLNLTGCPSGRGYVEAAASTAHGLLYVQVSGPGAGGPPSVTDDLLAGISLR